MSTRSALVAILYASFVIQAASGQGIGPYLNFEAPVLDGIVCLQAGTNSYLVVCNPPDDSIEIRSITGNPSNPPFIARVAVGLEPVNVIVKPTALTDGSRRCYVANWLGDSVSIVDIATNGTATLQRTVRVGDEPIGLALTPDESQLIITFSAQSLWGVFDPTTLQPVNGWQQVEMLTRSGSLAIKDPRAIAFAPPTSVAPSVPNRLCVLNHGGGNDASVFDYDLWATDSVTLSAPNGKATVSTNVGGLGSTNFNMKFAANGDLYVVSQHARNDASAPPFITGLGEAAMALLVTSSTGFVTSQLVRLRGAGAPGVLPEILDLNSTSGYQGPQAATAITQPTAVAIQGDGSDLNTRIFVTGFDSDTLGMIVPNGGVSGWTVTRIDLGASPAFDAAHTSAVMRGPRALALNAAQDRLYVYNRIENSVTIVDAQATTPAVVSTFALTRDPTPAYIKNGRKFLYSSRLSGAGNASGSVACASCHIDGNTDFLAWQLSDGSFVPPSTNDTSVHKGGDPEGRLGPNTTHSNPVTTFYDRKGPMLTQSLRGLVNFEVDDDANQDRFFSNRPYHWRGDRDTFQDFNGAFVNLMALPALIGTNGHGLSDADMTSYREFVNSIHYPPNAEQPITRQYSGSMTTPPGTGSDPYNDLTAGSGAQLGLKSFFIENADGVGANRSCVQCHALPEGSNNRFTDSFFYVDPSSPTTNTGLDGQRIETPALRGLVFKERDLWRTNLTTGIVGPVVDPSGNHVRNGAFGLLHTGNTTLGSGPTQPAPFKSNSVADFVNSFQILASNQNEITRYLREFDTGVAPIVGRVITVDSQSSSSVYTPELDTYEDQASKANAEIAVLVRSSGTLRGFWYDVTAQTTTPYVEEPQLGLPVLAPMTRAGLIALVTTSSDLLVFSSVPLGSARRVAKVDTSPFPALTTSAPTSVRLRACKANTANADVTKFTTSWNDSFIAGGFNSHLDINVGQNLVMIDLQQSLLTYAASATPPWFGVTGLHHEPPRRFVVTGSGIKQGAHLRIIMPLASDFAQATATTPPPASSVSTPHPHPLEFPIYPAIGATGTLEWQTADEIDAYQLLALMHGGIENTIIDTLQRDPENTATGPGDVFQPMLHNWFFVQVVNDPANPIPTTNTGSWQRLTLE